MSNPNPAHIVLTNVRLSFVHLDQPYRSGKDNEEAKYSAQILLPKSDVAGKAKIDAAIQCAAEKAREKFGAAFPLQPKNSIKDGDGLRPSDGQPYSQECRGHWVFNASNKNRPGVVDLNLQPILNATDIYSGMYANVGVTFFGYNQPTNKGIGVALDNVQKVADGEPLGGSPVAAESDFAGIAQPAQPVQPQYTQPVQPQYTQPVQPQYTQPAPQGHTAPQATAMPGQPQPAIDPITGQPIYNN